MILLNGLTKEYSKKKEIFRVVDNLTFEVNKGEVFGLLGENGAGKTTTIRLLSTLITPTAGEAFINKFDIYKQQKHVRASIGVSLGDERSFYFRLSGYQNLEFFGMLQNIKHQPLHYRVEYLLKKMNLFDSRDTKFMHYSAGMKRKLNLCRALLDNPPILFFDEPSTGLDPLSTLAVRELIRELKNNGKTILISTQNLNEAEQICDKILIIKKGKCCALSTTESLKKKYSLHSINLKIKSMIDFPSEKLKALPFVRKVEINGNLCTIITNDQITLLSYLFSNSVIKESMLSIAVLEKSLEDIYISIVNNTD